MATLTVPVGYTMRPATVADVAAAAELFNTCSMEATGERQQSAEELANEWGFPGFDLERDTQLVFSESGQLAAYIEIWDSPPHVRLGGWGVVHPAHRRRGIGTHLLAWAEQRAIAAIPLAPADTRVVVTQSAPDSCLDAKALLAENGYTLARRFDRMITDLDTPPPNPVWPEGITVRSFDRAVDLPAVLQADQEAFADHWGYLTRPIEEEIEFWGHWIDNDPKFDPALWFLAMDQGQIAGICLCRSETEQDPDMGWINTLGVRRPWRRKGLGMALLRHAFCEFYRLGKRRAGLGVDSESLTGATRLYERAGMRVQRSNCSFEKELRPGVELRTQSVGV